VILAAALALPACSRGPVLGDGLPGEISCTSCHGSVNPAPPGSSKGAAAPTDIGVGAHQLHVRDGPIRGALSCAECHPMPATVDAPGHIDGLPATVTFVALAATGGTEPRWDREAVTCFGVYCHGATLAGGSTPEPIWTYAVEPDPSRPGICGTCHGAPPPPPHPPRSECHLCHSPTVTSDGTIDVAGGHHIDGKRDVSPDLTGACGLCHPVPGTSGAHAVHHGLDPAAPEASYGDLRIAADYAATTSVYAFGCGHCHPTNPAAHMDGNVEVELSGGPPGSIKARNGGAASFDRSTRACSEVYCHSSGQEVPAFVATPAWDGGESLGCDGCHANPPRYPSGGGGTPTANSHLALNFNGYSYGHFRWHGFRTTMYSEQESMHGSHGTDSDGAAPMTCQTCHSETVDPAHTGPSGFYYLDTSGDYTLPGAVAGYSCAVAGCHTELTGEQPQAGGKVLPRRHVNGARDVVFDGRTEPPASGLPVRSALPSRAYWVGDVRVSTVPIADGGYDEPTGGRTATTLSLHLANASYDPATKVCANVACHMRAYAGTPKQAWGSPIQYENVPGDRASCVVCHVGP
jgi:predicted CxxxxCH...CXXCH cytochrome family protein